MISTKLTTAVLVLLVAGQCAANAQQTNDFFSGNNSIPGTNAAESALNNAAGDVGGVKPGDFSDDEKRMQHKYRDSIKHAKDLISKGSSMMERGQKEHNDKTYKKGKIFKEIGERQLAELNANNPFPPPPEKQLRQDTADAAGSEKKPVKSKPAKHKFGISLFGKKKPSSSETATQEQQPSDTQ